MTEYNKNLHNHAKASTYENARLLRHVQTEAEDVLWQCLRNRKLLNLKFRRQHVFDQYVLDFYCHEKKLCIEVDGGVHQIQEVKDYDIARERVLRENGITVLRFSNDDVLKNISIVINKITDYLNK